MSIKQLIPGYHLLVRPWHFCRALFYQCKYGFPARHFRTIAITGTNGKTTTSFMLWHILCQAGYRVGILTTVGHGIDSITPQLEHMTTDSVQVLTQHLAEFKNKGIDFLILETTSHALSQFRILGIPIEIAIFTNLTHDHLDYHKTFANYRNAKLKLFKRAKSAVINADDPNSSFFIRASAQSTTYGIEAGDLRPTHPKVTLDGISFDFRDTHFTAQLTGRFNIYNALAAISAAQILGVTLPAIAQGLASLPAVEGRMTNLKLGQPFTVLVDYAHTPDAFEKVFASTQQHRGNIITVTGGAGQRDHSTRSIRGEIAGKFSQLLILTEDDSRDENPLDIIADFVAGAKTAGMIEAPPHNIPRLTKQSHFYTIVPNRSDAIQLALHSAHPGDAVLILGKGHEKTILRADGPHPFADIDITTTLLQDLYP